jgi:glycosyltransferase involved in cell wall biosynthesis
LKDFKDLSISAFFPIYNDWGTVGSMVASAVSTLKSICNRYEVILVDDGSDMLTKRVLTDVVKHYENVRITEHGKNGGYGAALQTGFKEAKYGLIFYTDGDAQYDPQELSLLLPLMTEDVDIVNGYKIKRSDPFYRVWIGRIYHWMAKLMFGFPIRDVDCDFRLIRKKVFDKVSLESDSGMICVEMITKFYRAGFRFAEVGVHHYFRSSGKSQFFNFKRIFRVGVGLIRLWSRLRIRKEF